MLDYQKDVLPYLQLEGNGLPKPGLLHAFYQASLNHRDRLRAVFRKTYPKYLDINRPKEQLAYKEYRKAIYRNPLRSFRRRTIDALDYIPQADDYDIAFNDKAGTAEDAYEKLVTDAHFTKDGNLADWFWKRVRQRFVDDPNAVLAMIPLVPAVSDQERVVPSPILVGCEFVYAYRKGEFCVLELTQKNWMQVGVQFSKTGKTLLFIDQDSYCFAKQVAKAALNTGATRYFWEVTGLSEVYDPDSPDQQTDLIFTPAEHECPVMPARKIGKVAEDQAEEKQQGVYDYKIVQATDEGEDYYESILTDSLPHIEAAQEIGSDIQVERNFHVSGQEWRYGAKKCPDSSTVGGPCIDGFIAIRDPATDEITKKVKCPKCDGGIVTSGSGADGLIIISAPVANTLSDEGTRSNLPTPPGGFIPRNIQPLQEFVKEYEREKKQAFETANMQFLMDTPEEQSGRAKLVDREELYRTLITNGAHLCGLLQFMLLCGACQRRQPDQAPSVLAPVRLSIENSEITRQELIEAVDKKFDLNLRKPLEKKLIAYQVGQNSDYYKRYELREAIDPYLDKDDETKLFIKSEARLTMQTDSDAYRLLCLKITLSIHFNAILSELLINKPGFLDLDLATKYKTMTDEAEKLNAPAKPVQFDPKTGLPNKEESQLVPTLDIKNVHQLD